MKKPNPSVKARKAANKRGKKRTDRAKVTQAVKFERNILKKSQKKRETQKFQQYLNNLMPGEM